MPGGDREVNEISIPGLKEGVRQRDRVYFGHSWVIIEFRVNVEKYWHVHLCVCVCVLCVVCVCV